MATLAELTIIRDEKALMQALCKSMFFMSSSHPCPSLLLHLRLLTRCLGAFQATPHSTRGFDSVRRNDFPIYGTSLLFVAGVRRT